MPRSLQYHNETDTKEERAQVANILINTLIHHGAK